MNSSETLGRLRVQRVVKGASNTSISSANAALATAAPPPLTCVLLHGFGAPGDDLVALVSALDVPSGSVFFFPAALHALQDFVSQPMFGDARCWWMIDFAAMEQAIQRGAALRDLTKEIPEGLSEAREALASMLDAIEAKRKVDPSYANERVVLGGFSQGSMLSIDLALRDPDRKLAGLVVLSGTLLAESEWTPLMPGRGASAGGSNSVPVFQSHGSSDPILPFDIAERLRDELKGAGVDVTFDPFAGPHAIPPNTLKRLSAWLRERA